MQCLLLGRSCAFYRFIDLLFIVRYVTAVVFFLALAVQLAKEVAMIFNMPP